MDDLWATVPPVDKNVDILRIKSCASFGFIDFIDTQILCRQNDAIFVFKSSQQVSIFNHVNSVISHSQQLRKCFQQPVFFVAFQLDKRAYESVIVFRNILGSGIHLTEEGWSIHKKAMSWWSLNIVQKSQSMQIRINKMSRCSHISKHTMFCNL